ncbi:hypothetical protein B0H13DRAFT_1877457 [Mycena leptocephala]|nr:hypothetical protein B0H13DRAFT_1877457 [Mycena leptocephala]
MAVLMQLSASSFQRETISRRLTIFLFYETPKVFRSRHNEVQQIGFLVIHSDPSDTVISTSLNAASARPCPNRPPRILVARRARPQRHGVATPEEDMVVGGQSALRGEARAVVEQSVRVSAADRMCGKPTTYQRGRRGV